MGRGWVGKGVRSGRMYFRHCTSVTQAGVHRAGGGGGGALDSEKRQRAQDGERRFFSKNCLGPSPFLHTERPGLRLVKAR